MKKKNLVKNITRTALLIGCMFGAIALTGCGKKTVNLNDYLKVIEKGYNEYGSVSVSLDYEQIIEDNKKSLAKKLNSEYFGDNTPEIAAQVVFDTYRPYVPVVDKGGEYKNGDVVEITWNTNDTAIDQLSKVLKVKCTYRNEKYTIKNLEEIKEVDPFEKVTYYFYGKNGEGTANDFTAYCTAGKNEDGTDRYVSFRIDANGTMLSNGDKIHLKIEKTENEMKDLVENYGIVLSRTEMDYELNCFDYYPEDGEIFEYITEETMKEYTKEFIMDNLKNDTSVKNYDKRTAKLVGAVFYTGDNTQVGYEFNNKNQMVFIYHIEDGIVPGGWYTYYAPNNDSMIIHIGENDYENKEMKITKFAGIDAGQYNGSEWYNKREKLEINWFSGEVKETEHVFEYNGLWYAGHKTVQETIAAFEKEYNPNTYFDHTFTWGEAKGNVAER